MAPIRYDVLSFELRLFIDPKGPRHLEAFRNGCYLGRRNLLPGERLVMYVVYRRPSDYPGKYVVRRWTFGDAGAMPDATPHEVCASYSEARESLPSGLLCLGRDQDDDPVIVESWV